MTERVSIIAEKMSKKLLKAKELERERYLIKWGILEKHYSEYRTDEYTLYDSKNDRYYKLIGDNISDEEYYHLLDIELRIKQVFDNSDELSPQLIDVKRSLHRAIIFWGIINFTLLALFMFISL